MGDAAMLSESTFWTAAALSVAMATADAPDERLNVAMGCLRWCKAPPPPSPAPYVCQGLALAPARSALAPARSSSNAPISASGVPQQGPQSIISGSVWFRM